MFTVSSANPLVQELPIATGTVIEQGELVKFTPGVGVVAIGDADQDDPILGVAMEPHDGTTAGRQKGLLIKIAVPEIGNPLRLRLETKNVITATAGSTTAFTCAGLKPATDDIFNGGYLQILTCAADSTLVGQKIKIADHTGATGVLTVSTQPAAFASGDTARICPGPLAITTHTWDLNSDGTEIDWDAAAVGEALELVAANPENMVSIWILRLNQHASYPLAL